MADLSNAEYTLHSSPFSLYSMMARHTIQLGSTTRGAKPPKKITLEFINHHELENLQEDYLIHVNPKGQVPAMTGDVLEQPLTDSLSITLYLSEKHYPAMLPPKYVAVISDCLLRIHNIPGLSFSIKNPTAEMKQRNPSPVENILKRTDISPEYRKALEAKLKFHDENNALAFQPEIVAKAHNDLRDIFAEIIEVRKLIGIDQPETEWIFGSEIGPTALDSHSLPLVLRCMDAGNAELVPDELQHWAKSMEKTSTWQKVMHGKPTLWNASMGPIGEMSEMMSL